MSPLRLYATQLAAIEEGTEGTPETLTSVNAILVSKLAFAPTQEQFERDVLRGTLSRIPSVSGKRQAKISFDVEMMGNELAGNSPDFSILLKGCGFLKSGVYGTSVSFKPTTAGVSKSITIGFYADGVLHKLHGCRGNVKFVIDNGKPGIMSFEFTAADYVISDVGLLSSVSYPTIIPPAFLNTSLTVDTYTAICSKIDLDLGNKVELRESMGAASGFVSALITGRLPKGSMDVEQPLVGGYDFYGKWKTPGTLGSLSLNATNGAQIVTLTLPQIRWSGIKPGDRNGIRTLGMDFEPCLSSGDDEIQLDFTGGTGGTGPTGP